MSDSSSSWAFCHAILPRVSRTFALTIPVLPETIRDSVCVAYLLCRIADTIEDRADIVMSLRGDLFQRFRGLLSQPSPHPGDIAEFLQRWPSAAGSSHQELVTRITDVLRAYNSLPVEHRASVHACVQEMLDGMVQSNVVVQPGDDGILYFCDDLIELERYCHWVAGTVGLMLTGLFSRHIATVADAPHRFDSAERCEQGRRFGLGLQLTNILKDAAVDRERRVSYLPAEWLDRHGTLKMACRNRLVALALQHLDAAQQYTLSIPLEAEGIRLFCLWCLWMAVATLREVARAASRVFQPKIDRSEVQQIVSLGRLHVRNDGKILAYYQKIRDEVATLVSDT